jgi:hypothetical protein
MKVTAAQTKTLKTIAANGGEMDGYAGQKGFYCASIIPLERLGLLEQLGTKHKMVNGVSVGFETYCRVKLTAAAYEWLAAN